MGRTEFTKEPFPPVVVRGTSLRSQLTTMDGPDCMQPAAFLMEVQAWAIRLAASTSRSLPATPITFTRSYRRLPRNRAAATHKVANSARIVRLMAAQPGRRFRDRPVLP